MEDGFLFPEPPPPPPRYNPFENKKFLLKMGTPINDGHWSKYNSTIIETVHFPEQPQWSKEFLEGITFDSIEDEFVPYEDPDLEDGGDLEPDSDFEPEETDNDEDEDSERSWQPAEDINNFVRPKHIIDVFLSTANNIILI